MPWQTDLRGMYVILLHICRQMCAVWAFQYGILSLQRKCMSAIAERCCMSSLCRPHSQPRDSRCAALWGVHSQGCCL